MWWTHLTDVDKASVLNIDRLVSSCEDVLETERGAWMSTSMAPPVLAQGEGDETKAGKEKSN